MYIDIEEIDNMINESKDRLYRFDLFNSISSLLCSIGFKVNANYPTIAFSQMPTESYAILSIPKLIIDFPVYNMKSEEVSINSVEELLIVLSKAPMCTGDIKSNISKALRDLKLTNLLCDNTQSY